jgi:hypothetical protein
MVRTGDMGYTIFGAKGDCHRKLKDPGELDSGSQKSENNAHLIRIKSFLVAVACNVLLVGVCRGDTYSGNGATLELQTGTTHIAVVISDAQNHRVGYDKAPADGSNGFKEIPNSYVGVQSRDSASHPLSQVMGITGILQGVYSLRLLGLQDGRYHISLNLWTYEHRQFLQSENLSGEIKTGEIIQYTIDCESDPQFVFKVSDATQNRAP